MTPISYRSPAPGLYSDSIGIKSPPKPSDFDLSTSSGRKAVRQALGNRDTDHATVAMILKNTIETGTVYELDIITDDLRRGVRGDGGQTGSREFSISQEVRDLLSADGIEIRLESAGVRFKYKLVTEVQASVVQNSLATQNITKSLTSRSCFNPERNACIDQALAKTLPVVLTAMIYAHDEEDSIPILKNGSNYVTDVMSGNDLKLKRKIIQSAIYLGCVPFLNDCIASFRRVGRTLNLKSVDLSGLVLRSINLTRTDLSGANLQDSDLSGAVLDLAILNNAKLAGTDLSEASLKGADLSGLDLRRTKLCQTICTQADMNGVNLSHVSLFKINFSSAKLHRANLEGARLTGSNLSFANLNEARFVAARMTDVELAGCTMRRANISWATFVRSDLKSVDSTEIVLNSAKPDDLVFLDMGYHLEPEGQSKLDAPSFPDLFDRSPRFYRWLNQPSQMSISPENSGRIISEFARDDVVMKQKIITYAVHQSSEKYLNSVFDIVRKVNRYLDLDGINLSDLDLRKFDFSETRFRKANLSRCNLSGANLLHADLTEALLDGAVFRDSQLSRASLYSATATSACFANCNLSSTILTYCELLGADLTNANLSGSLLLRTAFRQCNFSGAILTGVRMLFTRFSFCNMTGTVMTGAEIYGATMDHADLSLAKMPGLNLRNLELSYSTLESTELSGADLTAVHLKKTDLSKAYLTRAQLPKADPETPTLPRVGIPGVQVSGNVRPNDSCSIL